MRYFAALFLLIATLGSAHAANAAVDRLNEAMKSSDYAAKKQAVLALASGGEDDEVLPALINAVGDRQVGEFAIKALRQRTGLRPAARRGENPGYPGYPATDTAGGWSAWLTARTQEQEREAELADAREAAESAQAEAEAALAAANGETEAAAETADPNDASAATTASTDSPDYGKLDRIFFTDGSIMRCYIVTKRVDLEGQMTSLRIQHRSGGGEEVLDAALIARIEEDFQ